MDALTNLQQRVSSSILAEPAPTKEQLAELFQAALRAPDHGALTPWRFVVIEGEARAKLGDVLHEIQVAAEAPTHAQLKAQKAPLRAPMIIVVIASIKEGKIPPIEQEYSAAAAAQNILLAAEAQNLGAIWRTGWPAFHERVYAELGLTDSEKIVGFIYLGQRAGEKRPIAPLAADDFVSYWG